MDEGTTLTEEGEFGYAMFAVVSGTADVFKGGDHIRTLGAGDVFGEIAVFYGGQRTATVVATSPMRLVMLFNGELARPDREVPPVGNALRSRSQTAWAPTSRSSEAPDPHRRVGLDLVNI